MGAQLEGVACISLGQEEFCRSQVPDRATQIADRVSQILDRRIEFALVEVLESMLGRMPGQVRPQLEGLACIRIGQELSADGRQDKGRPGGGKGSSNVVAQLEVLDSILGRMAD